MFSHFGLNSCFRFGVLFFLSLQMKRKFVGHPNHRDLQVLDSKQQTPYQCKKAPILALALKLVFLVASYSVCCVCLYAGRKCSARCENIGTYRITIKRNKPPWSPSGAGPCGTESARGQHWQMDNTLRQRSQVDTQTKSTTHQLLLLFTFVS